MIKLTLKPFGYDWDYESALESPTAPAGTRATYSDTGSGTCNGFGRSWYWSVHAWRFGVDVRGIAFAVPGGPAISAASSVTWL